MTFKIICYIIGITFMIGIIAALIVVTVINKKADNERARIVKRIKEVISLDDIPISNEMSDSDKDSFNEVMFLSSMDTINNSFDDK